MKEVPTVKERLGISELASRRYPAIDPLAFRSRVESALGATPG